MCNLGLALGKTLTELDALPEAELELWVRFYAEQPFGLWREDWRSARIEAAMINTVAEKPVSATDLMVFYRDKPQDGDESDGLLRNRSL